MDLRVGALRRWHWQTDPPATDGRQAGSASDEREGTAPNVFLHVISWSSDIHDPTSQGVVRIP